MNRVRLFLLVGAFCCTCLNAQTVIGYTNGTAERSNGVRFGSGTKQGLALKLTAEKVRLLQGCTITGIRSTFGTRQITDMEVFITRSLDGDPLYSQSVSGASTSWSTFSLDEPYAIDGEGELYVGYTMEVLSDAYKPLSFDESNDLSEGLFWGYDDGEWTDVSRSGYGAANIRLVVEGLSDFTDVVVKPMQLDGYYKAGTAYTYSGQLFNFGTTTISSFDLVCQIGENEPMVYKQENVDLAANSTFDFEIADYVTDGTGLLPMTVTVKNINGGEQDADESDNVNENSTYIYPSTMEKRVLIEMFTGLSCPNCPTGHSNLNAALGGIEDEFVVVAHHAGYYPDAFSMTEDWNYCWFYNSNSYYAPAIMANRTPVSDGQSSAVMDATQTRNVNNAVQTFRTTQPYVSIDIESTFDETVRKGEATVHVYTYVVPSEASHRLNLFLIQDGITGYYQSGAGLSYVHDHVFRGALSNTWGDAIELVEGQTVSKTYEFEIPEEIMSTYQGEDNVSEAIATDLDNMYLVAFVGDLSTTSSLECPVYNANSVKVGGQTPGMSGIGELPAGKAGVSVYAVGHEVRVSGDYDGLEVYDLSGHRVKTVEGSTASFALSDGFYVVRVLCDGKAWTEKLLIRK